MKEVILKWFDRLNFPNEWRDSIAKQAENFSLDEDMRQPKNCLLYSLYKCESLCDYYKTKGISDEVLLHTLSDLLIWTNNHFQTTGELGIYEVDWIQRHLDGTLFRLGRLQFCTGEMEKDYPKACLKKSDSILEVHIPQGESLTPTAVAESFSMANDFFKTYFPEYKYDYYTCHSWMLDHHLKEFLAPESNLIRFQELFEIMSYEESNQALKYLFDLRPNIEKESYLQKKVREHVAAGGVLCEGYGIIPKNSIG